MKKSTTSTQAERLRQAIRHRQAQEKQELRQAILTAAGELFLEQGYERFSLRKVAERIGQQLAAAAESQEDPWERLIALGRAYVTFGLQNPVYYQLMFLQRTDFLTQRQVGESQPRIASFQML